MSKGNYDDGFMACQQNTHRQEQRLHQEIERLQAEIDSLREVDFRDKQDAERFRKLERLLKSKRMTLIENLFTPFRFYRHPNVENFGAEIDAINE